MMRKVLFLVCIVFSLSCKKEKTESISELDISINRFIWNNLNANYLWSDYVPALNSNNYSSENDIENKLLKNYSDHKKFFDTLLYDRGTIDKYSHIIDDYENYETNRDFGKSKGLFYNLFLVYETRIVGLVMYVVKGGPADRAGIKRGDFFNEIDGITLSTTNYIDLLSKDSYKISLAEYSSYYDEVVNTGKSFYLTSEVIHENPIFLDTMYNISPRKVGYLMLNSFNQNFDTQLNNIFARFKAHKVNELIIDLRYNWGGDYSSAINLASMIYSTDNNKIFGKSEYNTKLQQRLVNKFGENFLNSYFTDKVLRDNIKTDENINSLGLTKVYFITSQSTAATAEMLINNLMPHINVYTYGNKTFGNGLGMMYIKDYDQNNRVNSKHKWAVQLVVMKSLNINGNAFYNMGIEPYYNIDENYKRLFPLGSSSETLLNAIILKIPKTQSGEIQEHGIFDFYADKNDLSLNKKAILLNNLPE